MLKVNDIEVPGNVFFVFHVEEMSQIQSFSINRLGIQNQRTHQFIEVDVASMKKVKSNIKNVDEYHLTVMKKDIFQICEVVCYVNLQSGKLTGFCKTDPQSGVIWKLNRIFCKGEV